MILSLREDYVLLRIASRQLDIATFRDVRCGRFHGTVSEKLPGQGIGQLHGIGRKDASRQLLDTVWREGGRVVLTLFNAVTSNGMATAGSKKKTITRGMFAWVKVLSAETCPGPGSFDRIDGNRVGLFRGR